MLIETPINSITFIQMAEKLQIRLPIDNNDLYKEEKFSFLNRFECFTPVEIRMKKRKSYFTAVYEADLHEK